MAPRNVPLPVRSASIPAGTACVGEAVAVARAFAEECSLDADAAARLAIVVEELVCNLVDYAGLAPDALIGLRLERMPNAVALILEDGGKPFDPRRAEAPELPPDRGGGAGLAMIRAWAKIEDYRPDGGINRLILTLPD